ncbi:hypothetical protein Amsp01_001850 [Amycolatopsis sp. NBRC 101858]|uniref:hypothetical protein n=1 Tax=Amycolatopsis sp. NBRC 101858 TaxID=3032200 RepID=UPI0024A417C5|nr:hypothetical protein [Amycolatopsis sp. NBRC 101858]GLY34161.1 hypothetical protein Amsp01_001850 [Amycolatopsis sp. NBRC 101858]
MVFLPEEFALNPEAQRRGDQLIVQPDATIASPNTLVLLEAKAIRSGTFGPEVSSAPLAAGRTSGAGD